MIDAMIDAIASFLERLAAGAVTPAALILGALIFCAAALLVRNALSARGETAADAAPRTCEADVPTLDHPLPAEEEAEPMRRAA